MPHFATKTCPSCSTALTTDARFCGTCGHAVIRDEPGKIIAGRYEILSKLGEGGMGAVYRAMQITLKREVALKVLRPELGNLPGLLRRFNAEAELAAKLSHPNTVTLYDFGQDDDGALFIAMEYIKGQSLREKIAKTGALPLDDVLSISEQVCASLADAHAHGIVHRDLKPDNVMLTTRGRRQNTVRVLDFGIAKLWDGGNITKNPMTQAGDLLGTPQYMAPEQVRAERVDGRTDVYALGCMLYEMTTGSLPFIGPTVTAVLSKHLMEAPLPPHQARPDIDIPNGLDRLILTCMNKQPDARPATMDLIGQELNMLRQKLGFSTPASASVDAMLPTGKRAMSNPTPPSGVAPTAVHSPPPRGTAGSTPGGFAAPTPWTAPASSDADSSAPQRSSRLRWIVAACVLIALASTAAFLALSELGSAEITDDDFDSVEIEPSTPSSPPTKSKESTIPTDFDTNPKREIL